MSEARQTPLRQQDRRTRQIRQQKPIKTAMMKNRITLVTCALLLSSLTVLAYQGSFAPDQCCFDFVSTRLRKDRVVSFKYTDDRCSMEGVLFKMKSNNEICADPSQQWVKMLIKAKEKVRAN